MTDQTVHDDDVVAEQQGTQFPVDTTDIDNRITAARSRNASVEELKALQAARNDLTGEGGEDTDADS